MAKRMSVSLGDEVEEVLASFADPETFDHSALQRWVADRGPDVRLNSDASLVRVLVQAGADAVRAAGLEAGYADLAASYGADEESRGRRRRRSRPADPFGDDAATTAQP